MIIKLILLPQYKEAERTSQDVLRMAYDEVLWEKIITCEQKHGKQVERPFESYLGNVTSCMRICYGHTISTPMGDLVKEVEAWRLKTIFREHTHDWKMNHLWRNKAVIQFVDAMPDKVLVWLYWY